MSHKTILQPNSLEMAHNVCSYIMSVVGREEIWEEKNIKKGGEILTSTVRLE